MRIEKYKYGDELKILELFELSFGKKMTFDYWEWRYKNNPHFNKQLIHLMWDETNLVGHYALSPVKVIINGIAYLSGLSMTTMTHPEYRGKGIFTKLANSVYEEAFDLHDFIFVWGFPNANSHYGFIDKLGWKDDSYVPMLSLKPRKNPRQPSELPVEILDFKKHSNLGKSRINFESKFLEIQKDPDYLNWRFFQNPTNTYRAFHLPSYDDTYLVYKKFRREDGSIELDIVDYFFKKDKLITELYITTLLNLSDENIAVLNTWAPLNNYQHLWFERLGFQPILPITYFGRKDNPKNKTDIPSFSELTMCYSDVF